MRIERLIIQDFGRLQNIDFKLNPEFQMVYGANEQGKSTMMAFIRSMFYGFSGGSRKLEANERRLYTPWNGQRMAGAILFEHQGKRYRLERQFGKTRASDKTTLMHDTTGKTIEIGSQNEPGQFLFDLSENEFTNTVFVRQLGSQLSQSDELLARLSNLAGSGDASVSHNQIDQRLKQAQTDLIAARGRGGKINELTDSLERLHMRRDTAVEAAGQQNERMQTLQLNQQSLDQLTLAESQLLEQAEWQEKLIQTTYWRRIEERRLKLEQARQEQAIKEQALQFGSHTVTDTWLNEMREREHFWREKVRQLKERQQALAKVLEQSKDLEQESERFKNVSGLNRTHIKTLRSRLAVQKNAASALKAQVSEQETALAELKKLQAQLDYLQRSEEAGQIEFDKVNNKARLDLDEAEATASNNAADIVQADLEYEQKDNELSQHRQTAAMQSQSSQPRLGCSRRCRYFFAVGLVLSLLTGASAFLLNEALIWFAILPFMFIPLLFWLTERKNLADRHSSSIRQTWQQRLYMLESDLRLAGSRQETARRIFQLSQRAVNEARQRWQQIQEQALTNAEKQAASKKALQLAIDRCQGRLQADELDQLKQELRNTERVINADASAISEILHQSGCADWDQFESCLQEYDQHMGTAKAMYQNRQQAETQLELAQAEADKASALLTDLLSIIDQAKKPVDAAALISQLQESLRQAELARTNTLQDQNRFQDILGERTYADWKAAVSQIQLEMAEMKLQPSLLSEEQIQQLRSEIRENKAAQMTLREKIAALESVTRLSARHQEPVSELDQQIAAIDRQLVSMKLYYQRLSRAREALDQAASELQNSFGPRLNQKAGAIMAELTAGKYDELKIDRSFMVRLADPSDGNFHEWQYLSGGTIDQVYLALRLAIADLICEQQECLPLLFDDILIQYDDIRTQASLNYLGKRSRQTGQQILLFSCQKRFSSAIESAGWPVIELA